MSAPIRILHIDDNPLDAQLVALALEIEQEKLPTAIHYVQTKADYLAALDRKDFDLILSDYRMGPYDGDQALAAAKEKCPEIPFIMVTGELGEEMVIETLKRGATDYVLKDRIFRLVPAITRALQEAESNRRRKEAETRVVEAHEQISETLESIQDPFYVVDKDWRFTYLNSECERYLGKTQAELLGTNIWDAYPQLSGSQTERFLRKAMQEHVLSHTELKAALRDAWVEIRTFPKADGGMSVLYRDITQRKTIEQALHLSQERFSAAFEGSPYPQSISRVKDGVFITVNRATLAFYGMTREEMVGHSSYELGILANPKERDLLIAELTRDGQVCDFPMHVKTRTHGEREILLSVSLFEAGEEQTMLSIINDITDRKQAEEALARSQRQYREVVESANSVILRADALGHITFINPYGVSFFGYSAEELLGRHIMGTLIPETGDEGEDLAAMVKDIARHPSRYTTNVHRNMRKDGSLVWMSWANRAIVDDQGRLKEILAIGNDITQLKEAQEKLEDARRSMQEVLESVDDALYGLDREWRFVYVNPRAEHLLRKTRAELLGKNLWEIFPQVQGTESDRQLRFVMERRKPVRFETHSAVNGAWIDVLFSPKADGGISVMYRDIRKRKAAETALRLSEERFSAAFKGSPYPQLISRIEDGVFLDVNDALLSFYGMTRDEMIGHSSFELGIVTKPEEREEMVKRVKRDGVLHDFPMHVNTRPRGERLVLLSVSLLKSTADQTALMVLRDVAAEEQAREEVASAHRRVLEVLESIQDAFCAVDRNLKITFVNNRAGQWWNQPPAELLGKYLWDLFPMTRGTGAFEAVERARRERAAQHAEWFSPTSEKWAEAHFYPTADGGLSVYFRDITERKEAELKLAQSEKRYRDLFEKMTEGFLLIEMIPDAAGKIITYRYLDANPALERLTHLKRGEILGKTAHEVLGVVELPWLECFARVAQTGKSERLEEYSEALGGWYDVYVYCPEPGQAALIYTNATERKLMEKTLQENRETLALAVEATGLGLFDFYPLSGRLEWSPLAKEHFGLPPEAEVNYSVFLKGLHPEDRTRAHEAVQAVLAPGSDGHYHIEYRTIGIQDGRERWLDARARVFFNEQGEAIRMIGATNDISAEKRLIENLERRNQELESERARWQHLIEGVAGEVWVCDPQGKMALMNLAANPALQLEEFSGRTIEELNAELDIINPDGTLRMPEEAPLLQALKGKVVRGEEIIRHRTTGITRYRQYSVAPVSDCDGNITGSVAIVQDITEAKQTELEARQANIALHLLNQELEERVAQRTKALERANQDLESFSYTVAHDLKAPLRAIDSFSRLLIASQQAGTQEKQAQYVKLIQSSTAQMGKLIESLLTFARTSRQPPQKVRVNMHALLEQVIQELRQSLAEEASRAHIAIGEMPPEANGDPVLLRQVFTNLLSNALKFTRKREEPRIEIGGYRRNGDLVYFVRDNGVGFPASQVEKLFQVFQRLHGQGEFEGNGIGLASVRKIVERHGGNVCAEGEEGKGATFYFTLPSPT